MKAGDTVSHYRILEKLGEGGMGVVYRALDQQLDRTVALKLLLAEAVFSEERKQRFIREAKAASALNHPHIVTIYGVGEDSAAGVERNYIAMEHVEGGSLLKTKPLGVGEALGIALQIADALSAAHEAGIVHRDVKPANILLTKKGDAKLADFGLAKLTELRSPDESDPTRTAGLQTEAGAVIGTAAYMSPEQAEGKPVDCRSDIFSFGSVLYEMLTGHQPFAGDSNVSTRMAILGQTPAPPRSLKGDVPPELERVVLRCLEKQREGRHATGAELLKDLQRVRALIERAQARRALIWRRPAVAIPAALIVLAGLCLGAWFAVKNSRARWARSVAIPEIALLAEQGKIVAAYDLARRAREILPADPELERLWKGLTLTRQIRTEPSGADVYWRDYADSEASWQHAGRTPLEKVTLPASYLRWRIEKEGFESQEFAGFAAANSTSTLRPVGSSPTGMVWVPGGSRDISGKSVAYADFWLDRFEVTNREFKKFVDAAGYRGREHWKEPFLKDGREISWENGIRELVDKTGRPGPSTWALGTYADGEEEYPVRGVSWYEAAAFASFTGKSLPTYYHWLRATDQFGPPSVLELSNFGGKGPAPVGRHQGLGPFGTYDMAGNVKEWCWNRSADKRYTLGGAWNDAVYLYRQGHAQPAFDRSEIYGFRCARYQGEVAEALRDPIQRTWRDYAREKPVDDAAFRLIESIYAYDRTELKPETQLLESAFAHWRLEKASFQAAYGNERVIVYLYLPKSATPPYQTVLYFPGSGAESVASHDWDLANLLDFVIKSGRAVVVPAYNGLYERRFATPLPGRQSRARRDLIIQWHKDLARTVDYLESRKDIDSQKLAYYGFSLGTRMGVLFTPFDKRIKASILLAGGLDSFEIPPEIDEINFLTRVKVPTLMLNGRDDFRFPLEVSQKPMFRFLGPPEGAKRHAVINGGHIPVKIEIIKEVLDWLDRYLGPVAAPGS